MKPNIVYWNNIPAPYMVDRFNAIANRGNINLTAWFKSPSEKGRSWEVNEKNWEFDYRYIRSFSVLKKKFKIPPTLFKDRMPDILVSLYAEPIFLIGWLIAHLRGIKTAFWTEITFDKWVSRCWCKEKIKKTIFPMLDGVITVGHDGRMFANKYGVSNDRIYYVPHVIDSEYFKRESLITSYEKQQLRSILGLKGVTFIYVGRLWWGKGLDYLIDAFKLIKKRCNFEISLLLVGDGEDEKRLRNKCLIENIHDIVFAGFYQNRDLPKLYAIADIFVFPTLGDPYGLVVDEAMACSLPVICSNITGEINKRVSNGVNGYVVPPENSVALADSMEKLAKDYKLRKKMGEISWKKVKGQTMERWAKDFEKTMDSILSK